MVLVVKNLLANAVDTEDVGFIPGSGRSPGGAHGNPLQDSCLENPMYRGAWQAAVHGISKTERLTLGFAVSLRRGRAALVPQTVKTLPAMKDFRVRSLGPEDPLEKGMATHSSVLAWRIPRTGTWQTV